LSKSSIKQDAPGRLIGVGVGPGDPKNLTLRAIETLRTADRVIAPCSAPDLEGRAENIVRQVLPDIECHRIVFDMSQGETGVQARRRCAKEAANDLLIMLREGLTLAFVTLGDPNVFSTFSLVAKEVADLAPEIEIRTVPGIMAFQEVASMSGLNLLDETEKLFLVTAFQGIDDVKESLQHDNAAVVIYKGGRQLAEVKQALHEAGRLEGAVVGELIGLEGERVTKLAELTDPSISYLATIISPPSRR